MMVAALATLVGETYNLSDMSTDKLPFEEAFAKLEETVQLLEKGALTLEESMRIFEEGISLGRRCNELLASAELKVTRLQTSFGEKMRLLQESDGN